jgi:hypothetical protein
VSASVPKELPSPPDVTSAAVLGDEAPRQQARLAHRAQPGVMVVPLPQPAARQRVAPVRLPRAQAAAQPRPAAVVALPEPL